MLIPLIEEGITADGVDSSAAMLEQCRVNLKKHNHKASLYEQDITDLSLPHRYDAVIVPTGNFCLFPKVMVKKVLTTFYDHLNRDGQIIIDLEMPTSFREGTTTTRTVLVSKGLNLILTSFSEKIDWLTQKTSYINQYELVENGVVIKTEVANLTLYWYGVSEFEMLLTLLGYKDIKHENGYTKQQSDIITFTAHK